MNTRLATLIALLLMSSGVVGAQTAIDSTKVEDSEGFQRALVGATLAKNPAAMESLGVMYEEGVGVSADEKLAFQWFLSAAALGDAEAMNRLGLLYAQGRGLPQDFIAAKAWYERGAFMGSMEAGNNLATMYFYGLGVPQDYPRAAALLSALVDKGDAAAMNKFAAMFEEGLGVTKDPTLAGDLFRRAAAQGYSPGMMNWGRILVNSHDGRDAEIRGCALLQASIELGLPASMIDLANRELQAGTARLKPRDLKAAKELAAQMTLSANSTTSGDASRFDSKFVSLRR